MIKQRPPGSAPAAQAVAEALPFADRTFDASLAVFTVQHWIDRDRGLSEMRRVARRRVVVLMSDPEVEKSFWLNDRYFPAITKLDRERLPSPEELLARLGSGTIVTVLVPHDCQDGFCSAFWRRPEAYLDSSVRSGISYFSAMDAKTVADGLCRLTEDLASGAWTDQFGHFLQWDELDSGQRLVIADLDQPDY